MFSNLVYTIIVSVYIAVMFVLLLLFRIIYALNTKIFVKLINNKKN